MSTFGREITCPYDECGGDFDGNFEHNPAERGDREYPGVPEYVEYLGPEECPHCGTVFTQADVESFEDNTFDAYDEDDHRAEPEYDDDR